MADKLGRLPSGQAEARAFARIMLAGAMQVEFDQLGRILIPDYLKNYAELKKEVVVTGLYNHLEIWDADRWSEYKQKTEKEVGDMAAKISELGI